MNIQKCTGFVSMKIVVKFIFLICVILLVSSKLPGQDVKFRQLDINDGLSQNAVFAILQDSAGFMWFGTKDGLNRYDGYNFVIHQHNPFDSTTISANQINTMLEDKRRNIWVGTLNGGLCYYQKEKDIFIRVRLNPEHMNGNNEPEIISLSQDSLGNIWAGSNGTGLFRISFNPDNDSITAIKQFKNDQGTKNSISSNTIASLFVDTRGVLWVGTLNGLNRYNASNQTFTFFEVNTKNPAAPQSYDQKMVRSIYESADNTFWLGTLSGLVSFNRETGDYNSFPHHYEIFRYGWGVINQIAEDNSGFLWLATPGELMRFNPNTLKYDYFRNDPYDTNSISDNTVSSVTIDRTGILWAGTAGQGINIYNPRANRFLTLVREKDTSSRISGFSIRSILEDSKGIVWVGTDVLFRWDRVNNELKSYETSSNTPNDFGNTGPWSIIEDSKGIIWTATSEGVYCYNPENKKIRQYKFDPKSPTGLPEKDVYTVFEDRQKNIWVITEFYLCKLKDNEKGIFEHSLRLPISESSTTPKSVLYQDKQNIFWIGTREGLIRYNHETKLVTHFKSNTVKNTSLNNDLIKSICPDPFEPETYLWIGTGGGGLNRINKQQKTVEYFTEADGLPNNVVYGILPDKNDNLWLSTNKGLSKFNSREKIFRNYDVKDGLQSNEFNTGAYYKSKSGELLFGGIKGLNYFYGENIIDNPYIPSVVLTNLKIDNETISPRKQNPFIQKSPAATKQVTLTHKNDIITFEFAALDYSAPEKNSYSYKLENFNDGWINSGAVRSATYTNLPSGDYIFKVKASNNDGIWNEEGTSVMLTVQPPWWRTWWAYVVYIVLFVYSFWVLRRYELNRLKLKNQLKIEKVESDTLRKLDQLKSQLFANISHEFRTPLTLILGEIDNVMSANIAPTNKNKLQIANQNAQKLLGLINQLLDLSKIDAGNMELRLEQMNLISFLKNIFFSFESLSASKKIILLFNSEKENIPLRFDPGKMETIFYNLLSNAFKFTNGPGEILLSVKLREASKVEISVEDTGVGIAGEHLPHIFDRFYQADSSSVRTHEGTGIGLTLVKELVGLHNGKITVDSKPGKGTLFTIELPLDGTFTVINTSKEIVTIASKNHHDVFVPEAASAIKTALSARAEKGMLPKLILVVEDNQEVRNYIREQLENNYRICEAGNGEEGLSVAQKEVPDLIITDVMMPQMDGYKFSRLLRNDERTSHIPVIMLTAKAGFDDKMQGLETGVDAFLTKPFSAKELKIRIKNLIHQRELLRKRFSNATVIKPSEVSVISTDQAFLRKTLKIIEANFHDEKFSVELLADKTNMSVSQLNRKLNALIDQPAGQLIRSLRLQRAADLLKLKAGSISEICYGLGFTDQAYFSRAFKKQFGITPRDYKEKQTSW